LNRKDYLLLLLLHLEQSLILRERTIRALTEGETEGEMGKSGGDEIRREG